MASARMATVAAAPSGLPGRPAATSFCTRWATTTGTPPRIGTITGQAARKKIFMPATSGGR